MVLNLCKHPGAVWENALSWTWWMSCSFWTSSTTESQWSSICHICRIWFSSTWVTITYQKWLAWRLCALFEFWCWERTGGSILTTARIPSVHLCCLPSGLALGLQNGHASNIDNCHSHWDVYILFLFFYLFDYRIQEMSCLASLLKLHILDLHDNQVPVSLCSHLQHLSHE